jgi:hypothetical protein
MVKNFEDLIEAFDAYFEAKREKREADNRHEDSGGSRYGDPTFGNLRDARERLESVFNEVVDERIKKFVAKDGGMT